MGAKDGSDCAVIAMLGDDPEDYMARSAVKWLLRLGVNVLTMSPGKRTTAITTIRLSASKSNYMAQIARQRKDRHCGGINDCNSALTAASLFGDISLSIAMTPSDFVWQGLHAGQKGRLQGMAYRGESLFSYKGKPLPYMPFCYQHPDYWRIISEESKRTGNMIASRKLFDDSEAAHLITEEEFIKVENIRGKLFLVGAEDDALWDTAKYIRRMEKRLCGETALLRSRGGRI